MNRAASLAHTVALSCRILAKLGLFKETTGHVSARSADGKAMLIRGRGKEETGLLFTRPRDIVLADFDGHKIKRSGPLAPPNESSIHGELYKERSEVGGIVHAHPPAVVLASIAGIELRPIFGGYDPRAMRLALSAIPIYESSITLHSKDQVRDMMRAMGDRDICILRGHGVVVVGATVEDATVKAIKLNDLARLNLEAASLGKVSSISVEDQNLFLSRRRGEKEGRGAGPVWRYYVEWLARG
jgi:ribulose-5-phosphate 4-epimerase/fuculose-1-phosphate aldolase